VQPAMKLLAAAAGVLLLLVPCTNKACRKLSRSAESSYKQHLQPASNMIK
jgi:hypothetical protein